VGKPTSKSRRFLAFSPSCWPILIFFWSCISAIFKPRSVRSSQSPDSLLQRGSPPRCLASACKADVFVTYNKESIKHWLFTSKNTTCPVSKHPLPKESDLTPNHTLRRLIQAWCTQNASHGINRTVKSHAMIMLKAIVKPGTAWAETRYCIIWADHYFRLVFSKFSNHGCFPVVQVFTFTRRTRSWYHGPRHLQEYEIHVARRECFILSCMMPRTSIRSNYLSLMRHTITFCRKRVGQGKNKTCKTRVSVRLCFSLLQQSSNSTSSA